MPQGDTEDVWGSCLGAVGLLGTEWCCHSSSWWGSQTTGRNVYGCGRGKALSYSWRTQPAVLVSLNPHGASLRWAPQETPAGRVGLLFPQLWPPRRDRLWAAFCLWEPQCFLRIVFANVNLLELCYFGFLKVVVPSLRKWISRICTHF